MRYLPAVLLLAVVGCSRDSADAVREAYFKQAKTLVAKADAAVEAYKAKHGDYPEELAALTLPEDDEPGLLEPKYLVDPWGRPLKYDPSDRDRRPLIYSEGPDPSDPKGRVANRD